MEGCKSDVENEMKNAENEKKIDLAAKEIMKKYKKAFEELAK